VELRREFRTLISLGEDERANMVATREMISGIGGGHKVFGAENLRRLGAAELTDRLPTLERQGPMFMDWEDPDRWVADGADLDLRTRTLRAVHTPGHTRGHLVYHDAAAEIMFASTHERVNELLAHHDTRLDETLAAVQEGHATPFEVAMAIKWTRRQTRFGDLDLFGQIQAVNETAAHLEVLLVRGQVTREISPAGADLYQVPAS
jgi:hypothetical protein